ncbi:MAG: hypothetical protein M3Z26_00630 [Bacteroidota bacterium]|nr:hypothetical protein [Bacteroidota bacterium]
MLNEKFIVIELPLKKSNNHFETEFNKLLFEQNNKVTLVECLSKKVEGNEVVLLYSAKEKIEQGHQSILDSISFK